jgi:hypothetical protein
MSRFVPSSFAFSVNLARIAKFGLDLLVETGKIEKLWVVFSTNLFKQDPSVNTSQTDFSYNRIK